MTQGTILDRIIERKHQEVHENARRCSLQDLEQQALDRDDHRGFLATLRQRIDQRQPAVIAEIKKASPSRGLIREDFDPVWLARQYADAGAACLSVLTDEDFFQGHSRYLQQARAACSLPVIRKDFIVDPYQVAEAGAMGADCLLLIVAALTPMQLSELKAYASRLKLDVLVEVHDETELGIALDAGVDLVGINNRNLHDFATDLDITCKLARLIPDNVAIVTESGIHTRDDVQRMIAAGVYGFLVGESLMRAPEPGQKYRELFG